MPTDRQPKSAPLPDDAPYEEVVARLQHVVERLEEGDLPLEESLQAFEEGVRLSRLGQRRLDEAEQRVEMLLAEDQGTRARLPSDKDKELDSR